MSGHTEAGDHLAKARRRERRTALGRKDERRGRVLLALEPAQRPQLAAGQRVNGLRAALEPAHMKAAMGKIDGVPVRVTSLRCAIAARAASSLSNELRRRSRACARLFWSWSTRPDSKAASKR